MKHLLIIFFTILTFTLAAQQSFSVSGKVNFVQNPDQVSIFYFELHDLTLDIIKTFPLQNEYSIDGLISSHDYTLSLLAEKSNNDLSGVSTIDLVVVQRHLLGVKYFNDNRQYIAADINNDLRVDVIDITMLRKFILGYDINLPHSWKGVAVGAKRFEHRHFIKAINSNQSNLDFDIIKIGDLY